MTAPETNELEITCLAVKQKLDCGDEFLLLDCREEDEHQLVRLPQAQLLPMSTIQERVGELEEYRSQEIVVHCHHGGRSLQVALWLQGQGYANVKSMAGGIDQWAAELDPSLPRY